MGLFCDMAKKALGQREAYLTLPELGSVLVTYHGSPLPVCDTIECVESGRKYNSSQLSKVDRDALYVGLELTDCIEAMNADKMRHLELTKSIAQRQPRLDKLKQEFAELGGTGCVTEFQVRYG